MNKIETKHFKFEEIETKSMQINGVPIGIVRGYASTYGKDRGDDMIMPGAFTASINRHIEDSNRPIRLYSQHNKHKLPIGGIPPQLSKEDERGLFIEAQVNLDVQEGREAYALAKQGVLSDFSIGFGIKSDEIIDGIRIIKEVELWEVSLVGEPMQPGAKVLEVKESAQSKKDEQQEYFIDISKAKEVSSKKEFEKILRESNTFSKDAAKYLAARFELPQREAESDDECFMSTVMQYTNEMKKLLKKGEK